MQTIYINEDKGSHSRETSTVDIVLYIGVIGRYLEEECYREFRKRFTEL